MGDARQISLLEDHIEAEFRAFHWSHPEVYDALVREAREFRRRRPDRTLGIGFLWERLRWLTLTGELEGDFKLNNNFRSRYARLIMACEPDLDGLFRTRTLRVDHGEVTS